jgi:Kdo2-lipid IVA lauroyltransferase/acyltransferase
VKKIRYALESHLLRGLAWLMGRLPRHVLLAFTQCLGFIAYCVDQRGRSAALENLRVTLGHQTTWLQRCMITVRAYQNFARTFCDLFWAQTLTQQNWQEHIEITGLSAETQQRIAGGSIWVTPHYGNFEISSLTTGFAQIGMHIVAQDFKNPLLTTFFAQLRQHSGHHIISQEGAMVRLLKTLKRGGHVAFLTDLNLRPSQATGAVRCMGLMTCVTLMHGLLAQRLRLPIVPALCEPLPDGRYRFVILPVMDVRDEESPVQLAQRVWDQFEPFVRAHPERWMWMYKHWRYLPANQPDPSYPDYANVQTAFAKQVLSATRVKSISNPI